jgi:hypothetical protein
MDDNILFIIAVKYYRTYKSYVKYYVDNIQKFYKNSFILLVDNNSKYITDLTTLLKDYSNLKIITNDSISKFEIGAYNEGIRYLLQNNMLDKYSYIVFSQDTFVLKNYFNFDSLKKKNIVACSFNHWDNYQNKFECNNHPINIAVLNRIDLYNKAESYNLCWCNSFILHNSQIMSYYNIVKDIVVTSRFDGSIQSERFLSNILYYLNNNKYISICGDIDTIGSLGYDCWTVDIENSQVNNYFIKKVQQKNESTRDE